MPKPNSPDSPEFLTAGTLGKGALMQLLDKLFTQVAANIADPNTSAKQKRKITLTLTLAPEADRKSFDLTIGNSLSLAPIQSHTSHAYIGKFSDGTPYLAAQDPRQELLFDAPKQQDPLDFPRRASGN